MLIFYGQVFIFLTLNLRKGKIKSDGSHDWKNMKFFISSAVLVWRWKMEKTITRSRPWILPYMNILLNTVALSWPLLLTFHVLMLGSQIGPTFCLWRFVEFYARMNYILVLLLYQLYYFAVTVFLLDWLHLIIIFPFLFYLCSYVHLFPSSGIQRHYLLCKEHL